MSGLWKPIHYPSVAVAIASNLALPSETAPDRISDHILQKPSHIDAEAETTPHVHLDRSHDLSDSKTDGRESMKGVSKTAIALFCDPESADSSNSTFAAESPSYVDPDASEGLSDPTTAAFEAAVRHAMSVSPSALRNDRLGIMPRSVTLRRFSMVAAGATAGVCTEPSGRTLVRLTHPGCCPPAAILVHGRDNGVEIASTYLRRLAGAGTPEVRVVYHGPWNPSLSDAENARIHSVRTMTIALQQAA